MATRQLPRVVVAGLAGDTGKSLVSLGIARALRASGRSVAPFKKGPDFIDAALLGAAARAPGRNLDTFMMPAEAVLRSLHRAASADFDIAVIEGNRGLFDGLDAEGSHSTAALARLIDAPVVLVIDATKVTRTVAALVVGCQTLDPQLRLAGVVLNRVGTTRQEAVIRKSIANCSDVPVLGAIPKLREQHLPSRHLGLVPAAERPTFDAVAQTVAEAVSSHVDLAAIDQLSRDAACLPPPPPPVAGAEHAPCSRQRARIGVLQDEAFSFYYPENLEALEEAGAELVPISPLRDRELPAIDGLYAGGGFPEVYADKLASNEALRQQIRRQVNEGLVVWAECGGLMYLGETLRRDDREFRMVGALPVAVQQMKRPQGHGYIQARVDRNNPFLEAGTELRGHEFHYSRLIAGYGVLSEETTVMALERGVGVGAGRDGLKFGNVVASYAHIHALGTPQWAPSVVDAAAAGGAA